MTISTLLVQIELGAQNDNLLQVTRDCAQIFNAGVIGIAASRLMQMPAVEGYAAGDLIAQEEAETERETVVAEAKFHAVLGPGVTPLSWRSTLGYQSNAGYVARQARAADLIVTGARPTPPLFDRTRSVDAGDLVMEAGRPVLIVPADVSHLKIGTIVVAWKQSRESRRVIADALPFLQKAARVILVEAIDKAFIADAEKGIEDVVAWLARHSVEAEALVLIASGDDAEQLSCTAEDHGADLLVAGAYGHSRLREWALGGVTHDLLMRPKICTLVSH